MLDLSVNQSKESELGICRGKSEHGVFVHYLALTFSTLLSSQVSGAHRAGILSAGLGQLDNIRRAVIPSQIGVSPSQADTSPAG
jgi:hypothetical protein